MDIRKRWGNIAGHVFCILFAVLFTAIASVNTKQIQEKDLQSFYYYDYQVSEEPEGFVTVFDSSDSEKKNPVKIRRDKRFSDGTVFLDFAKGEEQRIRSMIVKIKKGFPYDTESTLFYRTKDGKLDHDHKVTVSLPKGETTAYFCIPDKTNYKMAGVRLDFEDKYRLESVMVSEKELTAVFHPEEEPSNRFMIICFLAILFIAEGIRFYASDLLSGLKKLFLSRGKLVGALLLTVFAAVNGVFVTDALFEMKGKQSSSFWMIFMAGTAVIMIWELYFLLRKTYEIHSGKLVRRSGEKRYESDHIKGFLFWTLTVVILCRIILAFHDGLAEMSEDIDRVHVLIPFVVVLVQSFLLALLYRRYVLYKKENEIAYQKVYIFLFFVFGLSYLFLFLPFVSPDEPSHYLSAYRISDLLLGQIGQLGDKRLLMRMEDYQFFQQKKFVLDPKYYMAVTEALHLHQHQSGYVITEGPMVTNSIFSYFPAGFGMAIARVLNLSGSMTFYFGRLGNLLFFVFCFYNMMKMIPFGDTALFTMAMFPMTLHVAGSYSYDVVTFCIAAMFVIRVMQMIRSEGRISNREYLCCAVNGALMAPSKMVYVPLLLLIFLIPGQKLSRRPSRALTRKCMLVGYSLAFMVVVMILVNILGADSAIRDMVQESTTVNMVKWAHEEGYTISWIIHHPLKYLVMSFRTLFNMSDTYFYTLIGSKLGWLNIGVPQLPLVAGFVMFLLAVNIRDRSAEDFQPDGKTKGVIAVLCACSVMLTMLVMALNWTPVSDNYISGVQGRYFLPLLVPAIWLFRTRIVQVGSSIRKYIVLFEGIANVLILVYLFTNTMI